MSYLIHWSSQGLESIPGKGNITLADKTFDTTTTSLTLTGKGLKNYGLFQQENFLRVLENFASATAPVHPTIGQIWYKSDDRSTYIYTGTSSNTTTLNGWTLMVPAGQQGGGISEYNLLANSLNKIVGDPTFTAGTSSMATANSAFGWGQTDLVPVYADVNTLTPASVSAQASLPNGSVFPPTFSNASWTILLSRLRKALRQTFVPGVAESDTSSIGFLQDSSGSTSYGNILNNFSAGPVPHQGQVADYVSGWQQYGVSGVSALLSNTLAQINALKSNPNRFSLSAGSLISTKIGTSTRTAPTKSLTIPSVPGTYKLRTTMQFTSDAAMMAYFNSGGQIRFDFSFVPSAGSPSNVETDWRRFLQKINGLVFDYQGTKLGGNYVSPRDGQSSSLTMGFYGAIAGLGEEMFIRDVLSTLNSQSLYGLYASVPPIDGGVIMTTRITNGAGGARNLEIDIDFHLQRVTSGSANENDLTDNSLTGTLKVDTWSTRASSLNTNSPAIPDPLYIASGTFITAS